MNDWTPGHPTERGWYWIARDGHPPRVTFFDPDYAWPASGERIFHQGPLPPPAPPEVTIPAERLDILK